MPASAENLSNRARNLSKTATPGLIEKLASQFEQVHQRKHEFLLLAEETKSEVRIRLSENNSRANGVALAFARNFDSLSSQQLEQLMAVFNNAKKG